MFCEKCGAKNSDKDAFCLECGNSLKAHEPEMNDIYCEQCGTKNQANDVFCINCGKHMDNDSVPQPNNLNNANQHNTNQYNANQHHASQHNAKQSDLKQRNEGKQEESNTPLMILLSVSALILVGLIVVGVYLIFREPQESGSNQAVAGIEESRSEEPVAVHEPTDTPTAMPSEALATEEPLAEEPPVEEPPVEEPSDSALAEMEPPAEEAPEDEMPSEQARQSSPQRDSSVAPQVTTRNDFVFVDSDIRIITSGELDMLSSWQIRIARNELFARRGRMFEKEDMKEYFNSQAWYHGTVPAATFDANRGTYMNRVEIENMNIINNYEREHGINQ